MHAPAMLCATTRAPVAAVGSQVCGNPRVVLSSSTGHRDGVIGESATWTDALWASGLRPRAQHVGTQWLGPPWRPMCKNASSASARLLEPPAPTRASAWCAARTSRLSTRPEGWLTLTGASMEKRRNRCKSQSCRPHREMGPPDLFF